MLYHNITQAVLALGRERPEVGARYALRTKDVIPGDPQGRPGTQGD